MDAQSVPEWQGKDQTADEIRGSPSTAAEGVEQQAPE